MIYNLRKYKNFPVEAEYSDGYIHNEAKLGYISPYKPLTQSVYVDIREKFPEKEHGPMIRWTIHTLNGRIDIDWRQVPANSIPIRATQQAVDSNFIGQPGKLKTYELGTYFGYQYIDDKTGILKELLTRIQ